MSRHRLAQESREKKQSSMGFSEDTLENQLNLIEKDRERLAKQLSEFHKQRDKLRTERKAIDAKFMVMTNDYKRVISEYTAKINTREWDFGAKISSNQREIISKLNTIQYKVRQIMVDQERELMQKYHQKFDDKEKELEQAKSTKIKTLEHVEQKELDLIQAKSTKERRLMVLLRENGGLSQKHSELNEHLVEIDKDIGRTKENLKNTQEYNMKLLQEIEHLKRSSETSSFNVSALNPVPSVQKVFTTRPDNIKTLKMKISQSQAARATYRNKYHHELQKKDRLRTIIQKSIDHTTKEIYKQRALSRRSKTTETYIELLKSKLTFLTALFQKAFMYSLSTTNANPRAHSPDLNDQTLIDNMINKIEKIYENYEEKLKANTKEIKCKKSK